MEVNRKLYKIVKDEIISFDRFSSGQLLALDRSILSGFLSWNAKEKFTYSEWVKSLNTFTVVKVEGLEDNKNLCKYFRKIKIKDIHLFHSIKTDYSFGWHQDSVNVYLYVIKGKKRVSIKNKNFIVKAGEGILIPKGHRHRVFNYKNTWALSIGMK